MLKSLLEEKYLTCINIVAQTAQLLQEIYLFRLGSVMITLANSAFQIFKQLRTYELLILRWIKEQ